MAEQKIKQDISIGANIRKIRARQKIGQTELVRLLQLEGVEMTRETLVKIERGTQHIRASQLRGIRDAQHTPMTHYWSHEGLDSSTSGPLFPTEMSLLWKSPGSCRYLPGL